MSQLDENIVLMCAMRYALGRRTYVVICVTDELIKNWHHFKKGNQVGMLKEIREAIEKNEAGMDMDVKRWIAVVNHAVRETEAKND